MEQNMKRARANDETSSEVAGGVAAEINNNSDAHTQADPASANFVLLDRTLRMLAMACEQNSITNAAHECVRSSEAIAGILKNAISIKTSSALGGDGQATSMETERKDEERLNAYLRSAAEAISSIDPSTQQLRHHLEFTRLQHENNSWKHRCEQIQQSYNSLESAVSQRLTEMTHARSALLEKFIQSESECTSWRSKCDLLHEDVARREGEVGALLKLIEAVSANAVLRLPGGSTLHADGGDRVTVANKVTLEDKDREIRRLTGVLREEMTLNEKLRGKRRTTDNESIEIAEQGKRIVELEANVEKLTSDNNRLAKEVDSIRCFFTPTFLEGLHSYRNHFELHQSQLERVLSETKKNEVDLRVLVRELQSNLDDARGQANLLRQQTTMSFRENSKSETHGDIEKQIQHIHSLLLPLKQVQSTTSTAAGSFQHNASLKDMSKPLFAEIQGLLNSCTAILSSQMQMVEEEAKVASSAKFLSIVQEELNSLRVAWWDTIQKAQNVHDVTVEERTQLMIQITELQKQNEIMSTTNSEFGQRICTLEKELEELGAKSAGEESVEIRAMRAKELAQLQASLKAVQEEHEDTALRGSVLNAKCKTLDAKLHSLEQEHEELQRQKKSADMQVEAITQQTKGLERCVQQLVEEWLSFARQSISAQSSLSSPTTPNAKDTVVTTPEAQEALLNKLDHIVTVLHSTLDSLKKNHDDLLATASHETTEVQKKFEDVQGAVKGLVSKVQFTWKIVQESRTISAAGDGQNNNKEHVGSTTDIDFERCAALAAENDTYRHAVSALEEKIKTLEQSLQHQIQATTNERAQFEKWKSEIGAKHGEEIEKYKAAIISARQQLQQQHQQQQQQIPVAPPVVDNTQLLQLQQSLVTKNRELDQLRGQLAIANATLQAQTSLQHAPPPPPSPPAAPAPSPAILEDYQRCKALLERKDQHIIKLEAELQQEKAKVAAAVVPSPAPSAPTPPAPAPPQSNTTSTTVPEGSSSASSCARCQALFATLQTKHQETKELKEKLEKLEVIKTKYVDLLRANK